MSSENGPGSRIGLSSYAFFWQLSDQVSAPLTLQEALAETAALGVDLFQICDYAPLEAMTDAELAAVRATADALGISLELGTKGIRPEHLKKFLRIAGILGAPLVRTMFNVPGHTPATEEAVAIFKDVLPDFEAAGVKIAVETYEQVPTARILEVIRSVGSAAELPAARDEARAALDGVLADVREALGL